ncbi:hypothetical protein WMF31_39730 [Sorangium sp. So ce1036]|uniref:hypothetical protein n=1 Tax=Sorangium sp. So ce1036 TaxID=3133328 RepID=UPI003EFED41B
MGQGVDDAPDPMASQMARLLAGSDLDELREIVRRWVAEAPTEGIRRRYQELGGRLVELKAALSENPVQPSVAELEQALTMMLRLAASNPRT